MAEPKHIVVAPNVNQAHHYIYQFGLNIRETRIVTRFEQVLGLHAPEAKIHRVRFEPGSCVQPKIEAEIHRSVRKGSLTDA